MRDLVELTGKKHGYSIIDIFNQMDRIDKNISELARADYKVDIETLIITAIEYSLSFRLQNEYKHILNYVQERKVA